MSQLGLIDAKTPQVGYPYNKSQYCAPLRRLDQRRQRTSKEDEGRIIEK